MSLAKQEEVSYFQYNKIYVIETIPKGERQTGKELFDDLLKRSTYRHGWFDSTYTHVESKKHLFRVLTSIKQDAMGGVFPLIHLEAHGSPTGLEVGKGGARVILKWRELASEMRKINVVTKNNLMVSIASCHGINICKGIEITERAPFFGVIAPLAEVSPDEIIEGYLLLYDRIINTTDFDGAVVALRDSTQGENRKFTYQHAETVLRAASENIGAQLRNPLYRKQRLLALTVKSLSNVQVRLNNTIPGIVAHHEQFLARSEEHLNNWLANFIMKDLK